MKIVVAPDSFKGSLSTLQVCSFIEKGIKKVIPSTEVIKVPLADGGEGTVEALVSAVPGSRIIEKEVTGPLGEKVSAFYGVLSSGKTAVIEMAAASGLPLVPEDKRNPLLTTTYGTGELISDALKQGVERIIIGIGGSATVDGGIGALQALGVKFLDEQGQEVGFGGKELKNIKKLSLTHLHSRIKETKIIVASDVNSPLCGEKGAAYVYGPQKGATPEQVKELEEGLIHYAQIIKEQLGKEVKDLPGAGAAGGLGAGLWAFLSAEIKPGVEVVSEIAKLEDKIKDADLVITAEGKIDYQTAFGKAPAGVAKIAQKYSVPVIAFGGTVSSSLESLKDIGISAVISIINQPMSLKMAMDNAADLLTNAVISTFRLLEIGRKMKN